MAEKIRRYRGVTEVSANEGSTFFDILLADATAAGRLHGALVRETARAEVADRCRVNSYAGGRVSKKKDPDRRSSPGPGGGISPRTATR